MLIKRTTFIVLEMVKSLVNEFERLLIVFAYSGSDICEVCV